MTSHQKLTEEKVVEFIGSLDDSQLPAIADVVLDRVFASENLREKYAPRINSDLSLNAELYNQRLRQLCSLSIESFLEQMNKDLDLPRNIRLDALKFHLENLAGKAVASSLDKKQWVASQLQKRADEFGLLFVGPKKPKVPGRLRAVRDKNREYFRIVTSDNTVAGSYRVFPEVKLVYVE